MKKILVATDGSKYSQKALFKAKQLATSLNAEVTALTVGALYENESSPNLKIKAELRDAEALRSKKILDEAREIFADFPGLFCTVYKIGDVAEEIIKLAEADDFDLLIMGSRGLGAFSRTILGSVSDKVAHHSKITVMLVK
jgi:nucleotide-binding universal stress UspA family protein